MASFVPKKLMLDVCLFLVISFHISRSAVFPLEGESAAGLSNSTSVRKRPEASSGHTIHLTSGQEIALTFCLRRRSFVSISNAVYSNDGPSDKVAVWLDHTTVGKFSSIQHSNFGEKWKEMVSTGTIGKSFPLPSGQHSLILKVESADGFGVEVDKMDVFVSDSGLTEWGFKCIIRCLEESLNYPPPERDDVLPARFEQMSRSTSCAEEDNVMIPVYHNKAENFRLTASMPTYESVTQLNRRETDFSGCDIFTSDVWQIGKADGLSAEFRNYSSLDSGRSFQVTARCQDFPGIVNLGSAEEISLDLTFRVAGPSKGVVYSEVGSVLAIQLADALSDQELDIGLQYRGRQESFSQTEYKKFSATKKLQTWEIPDYTWSESSENFIRLVLRNPNNLRQNHRGTTIKFDFIKLNKRRENGEKVFRIYSSKDVIIEGLEVDFWWLSPNTIKIRRTDTGEVWHKVDFFRVYVRVPYTDSMAQIFVMYQDGNVRLLPLPPNGLDWIPFGSSVIVGQSEPSDFRPHADVKFIDLNPEKLVMMLRYKDGGQATFRLISKIYKTVLEVEKATYARNPSKYPFAMLRSMWVDDGNSDVEKVTSASGALVTRHILGNWKPFYATSTMFHRSCVSRHNILSPDIRVDILP